MEHVMAIPFLGKILDTLIDKGSDLISEFITDPDKAAEFEHKFKMAALAESQLDRELEAEMFKAQQVTIQAELHQSDLYTKRTRPKVARQSWYVTAVYALSTMMIPVLPSQWNLGIPVLHWEVFLVLASPALTYMGVRGFEKWKNGKTH